MPPKKAISNAQADRLYKLKRWSREYSAYARMARAKGLRKIHAIHEANGWEHQRRGGRTSGRKNLENGTGIFAMTPEEWFLARVKGARALHTILEANGWEHLRRIAHIGGRKSACTKHHGRQKGEPLCPKCQLHYSV